MHLEIRPYLWSGKTGHEKTIAAGIGMRKEYTGNRYFVAFVFFFVYLTVGFKIIKPHEEDESEEGDEE